jgi:hypothetical protein
MTSSPSRLSRSTAAFLALALALVAVVPVAWLLAASSGCSSDASSAPGGAGGASGAAGAGGAAGKAGAAGHGAAGKAGSAGKTGGGGKGGAAATGPRKVVGGDCPVAEVSNPSVDNTWVQFSGYGCDDALLLPGADSEPFAPIEWEPCPPSAGTQAACEQIAPLPGGTNTSYGFLLASTHDDDPILRVARHTAAGGGYVALARASGPVVLAYTASPTNAHSMGVVWFDESSYLISVDPLGEPKPDGFHGAIAGRFGEPAPTLVRHVQNNGNTYSDWAVSNDLVVRNLFGITASPWTDDDSLAVYKPADDPDGLPGYLHQVRGDRVFIQVNAGGLSGMVSWTQAEGVKPIVRYPGNYEKSAMRWSTDGVDMVWIEGEGPQTSLYVHPKMTLMTAPYSTDAAQIQATKRAVGPDPVRSAPLALVVGCGYTTSAWINDEETANGLAIVRLADSTWWKLHPAVVPYATRPLGITCTHVYYEFANQILRIRLDSLPVGGIP